MDELEQLITQLTVLRDQIVSGCEDHWILMVPSSIGELATVCALLPAFRAHHGGKICMVVDSGKRDVLKLFTDQIDAVKFVPLAAMRALSTYRIINPLDFRVGVPQNLWINQNGDGRGFALHELFRSQPGRGGLSFIDLVRYAMNLPWEAPIVRGNIELDVNVEAMRYAKVNRIEPGNSVVFFTALTPTTSLPPNSAANRKSRRWPGWRMLKLPEMKMIFSPAARARKSCAKMRIASSLEEAGWITYLAS